jgi:hypothetical protein
MNIFYPTSCIYQGLSPKNYKYRHACLITPHVTYAYNTHGRQSSITDATGTRNFTYDPTTQALTQEIYSGTLNAALLTRPGYFHKIILHYLSREALSLSHGNNRKTGF